MATSIPYSPLLCAPIPRRRTPTSQSLSFSSSNSSFCSNTAFSHRSSPSRVRVLRRTNRTGGLSCNCLFGLGVPELVVIAGVAALVFGPKKLPEVGRSIGKTVKSFQQAAKEFETELKKEPDSTAELPAEKPTAASEEEKEAKVPSTKENL
ncbi:sec-independent protein translocase protein TATA, chloroplastic [Diospyros lotus]|uniref:sec-independent protein translocase protein TATA, chloroplastic n=1 Tax=Diospyros lotus TaxID=55363 RepID=UPI00225A8EE3|nr:sec-independent protein translocase protein TATA, chloroplastic [Diospyros lotus]